MQQPGVVWQKFAVSYTYPVAFTAGIFQTQNTLLHDVLGQLAPGARVLVVLDSGLVACWPELDAQIRSYWAEGATTEFAADPLVVAGGEPVKNTNQVYESLLTEIHTRGLDRQSVVLGVGGGAMLDAVGYAAATAHRGVRMVRVPTTVLGQNDSGVGVKNGINAFGTKNFLGTFAPPLAVFNDTDFLYTLDPRDRASGMAESVKVALLRDPAFFQWLETSADALRRFDRAEVEHVIRRTAELHLQQIATSGDPFETGNARPLDYGHWSAHKLESLSGYELRHGEAVAVGMALDCRYASTVGLLGEQDAERAVTLLTRLGLPIWHPLLKQPGPTGRPAFLDGLEDFRQHLGGKLSIPLLGAIGSEIQTDQLEEDKVLAAASWLEARSAR